MNGKNITTGTVHHMNADGEQACGIRANQVAYLIETTEEITCRKCSKVAPKIEKIEAPKATVTPAMRKVLTVLSGGQWTGWSKIDAGIATLNKMVKMGLIEVDASETEYRAI